MTNSNSTRIIRILMNGVTGRMGANQHLLRSICAIRDSGGIELNDGSHLIPLPILTGRDPGKLAELASRAGGVQWTTDVESALGDDTTAVYFDAQTTDRRTDAVEAAIAAGKHVYCEKPTAASLDQALKLYHAAEKAGIKHGVVQDKLWLPGIVKLRALLRSGFFGKVLAIRGEFGYWVFTGGSPAEGGDGKAPQRPSWNYKAERGGGIIYDMLCHWRYLLTDLCGPIRSVSCLGATHIPYRWDEAGERYAASADDACYATFMIGDGVIAQFNSSWCTRVRRDDLLTIQVDGTRGSAVAGLRECGAQSYEATPRPVWNPDEPAAIDYHDGWAAVPDEVYPNAFRAQWELFLRHVAEDEPFPWNLMEGARGVQLAELGMQSWRERRWVDVLEPA